MVKRWNDIQYNRRTLKIEIKENYASSSTLIETKNERERERENFNIRDIVGIEN